MAVYRTEEQLEEIGRNFLRRIGLEHQVCPDAMTVINKLKRVETTFNYRRVPDMDMPEAEAEWNSEATEVAMRESVFTGMQHGDSHPRFVVFHELSTTCSGTRVRLLTALKGPLRQFQELDFPVSHWRQAAGYGLGPFHTVSLADAREKAEACRVMRLQGLDPLEERLRKQQARTIEAAEAITFEKCAETFIATHKAGWKNGKHADQWRPDFTRGGEPMPDEFIRGGNERMRLQADRQPDGNRTDGDALEAATDQAIAACGGDPREAIKALIVANGFLEADVERLKAAISLGYARGKLVEAAKTLPPDRKDWYD